MSRLLAAGGLTPTTLTPTPTARSRYEEASAAKEADSAREDLSDMVAEHAVCRGSKGRAVRRFPMSSSPPLCHFPAFIGSGALQARQQRKRKARDADKTNKKVKF